MSRTLTVARSESFLQVANLIDDLERWALQAGPQVDLTRVPDLEDDQRRMLGAPEGQLAVQDWLVAYHQSIALMRQFRNALVHQPRTVTDADLDEVTNGAERVLRGLRRRLFAP